MVTFNCEHCGRQMTAGNLLVRRWICCPACLRLTQVCDGDLVGRSPFRSVSERLNPVYHSNGNTPHR